MADRFLLPKWHSAISQARPARRALMLSVGALVVLAAPLLHGQTFQDSGTYSTTADKIAIGSSMEPAKQLEVFGDGAFSGDLSARDLTLTKWSGARGRFTMTAPRWVGMTLNATLTDGWVLDDPSTAGWFVKTDLRTGWDVFAIYRIPPGSGVHFDEKSLLMIRADGAVGLGTDTPAVKLHAVGPTSQFIRVEATDAAQNAAIQFKNQTRLWQVGVTGTSGDTFHIRDSTATITRVTIDTAGRVGIGTPAPEKTLDVAGDLRVSGEITGARVIGAIYQDLAEWVPAVEAMAAGTVVVLNPDAINEVMPSSAAYDSSVAGVVSEQPGIILGVAGDEKAMIATTGRVRVKVDATLAPIAVGDLLVTSEKRGVAMKSEPMEMHGRRFHQPGTIIGKSLEPLAEGTGEILVLLSLQ